MLKSSAFLKCIAFFISLHHNNKQIEIMTTQDYNNKANELNAKFPNLKAEVVKNWNGSRLEIKVINSDKAKTLREMHRNFNFTF